MKFDINNYKGKYVMHCKTKAEVEEFCDYLRQYNAYHNASAVYNMYNGSTCFNFNSDTHASEKFYKENGFTILEFSNFNWSMEFTKADLKDGMIVECRNGNRYLVAVDRLLRHQGYVHLNEYDDNLKHGSYTIVKVYTSNKPFNLNVLFDDKYLTLIWERKPEPVEMTIEEICKALGKEIKIVKG